jgi:hypothetical protein
VPDLFIRGGGTYSADINADNPIGALAARLKTAQANIARLEKGEHPSTNTLQPIAKPTGHKLLITLRKEA